MELYNLVDYKSFENSLKITSKRSDRKFLITQAIARQMTESAVPWLDRIEKKKELGKTERIEKRDTKNARHGWETPAVELAVVSSLNRETRQRRCVERKRSRIPDKRRKRG